MSMLLRAAPLRVARNTVARQQVRHAHFENVVDKTIPVNVTNKVTFLLKLSTYVVCGFGLPFAAAKWQMKRAAGA
ncbi:hypothetical protein CspeluHIS016_0703000 [Cutaneotrichosporon spelunceum]|uniref:Cytochrome c oxidase subunit 8, mitochondrial n=1 Tax=Cutaneotrichosporon spelunceum TaxID=1672016 RepID=A0AAD3YDJ9_9TREE|nr:hypothetical protein CspeluHIS016_0703000 [Cutaneotrichosporon spelunceum]